MLEGFLVVIKHGGKSMGHWGQIAYVPTSDHHLVAV